MSTKRGEGLSLSFPGANVVKSLSTQQLNERLAANDITLIDVRLADGHAQAAPLSQARILEDAGYESLVPSYTKTPRLHSSAITACPAAP